MIERLKRRLRGADGVEAWAAVAILLREDVDDYETLLVRRAVLTGDPWSGDMAFPGGKKAPCDRTLRDTIVREVNEETGIDLDALTYIGALPVLFPSLKQDRNVLPIVYLYEGRPEITLNSELTAYRWVHLEELRAGRTTASVKGWRGEVFKIGDDVVWGLTYRMLDKLLELLDDATPESS